MFTEQSLFLSAYKKQALLHHPDRLGDDASHEERDKATKRFQLIADAYYILSDATRRQQYDQARKRQQRTTPMSEAAPRSTTTEANHIFGNVFDELLRPEGKRKKEDWTDRDIISRSGCIAFSWR